MSYATDPMGAALDRHITGNYGEDQLQEDEWDEKWHPFICMWMHEERQECFNPHHRGSCIGRLDCKECDGE